MIYALPIFSIDFFIQEEIDEDVYYLNNLINDIDNENGIYDSSGKIIKRKELQSNIEWHKNIKWEFDRREKRDDGIIKPVFGVLGKVYEFVDDDIF